MCAQGVEDLCIHKKGENLYERLSGECEENIRKNIAGKGRLEPPPPPLLHTDATTTGWIAGLKQGSEGSRPLPPQKIDTVLAIDAGLVNQTPDPVLFLELVQHTWDAHCNQMTTIRSIFLYLDRTYVIQSGNVISLWEMGLVQFRRHLEAAPEVGSLE
jgi:hypothetical protein